MNFYTGQSVSKGRGHARIYLETPVPYELRTMIQYKEDLKIALRTGKPHHGICGPTPLSDLPGFDFMKAFVPEYMHACCQGVFKLLIRLWTLQKFSNKPWSIRKKLQVLNSRLSRTKPAYEITRVMGALDDLSNWKASMFRAFVLFFVDVLEDILPKEYFDHFVNLSYGMFVLLQENVSISDVEKIEVLFRRFVVDFEKLYGAEHVGINVHFLTHLPQSVLDWGCLWATSTFIPEWFNGVLMALSNGTQAIADQMATNYLLKIVVRDEAVALLRKHILPPHVTKKLCELLHLPKETQREFSKGVFSNENKVELLGHSNMRDVAADERNALRNLFSLPKYSDVRDSSFQNAQFFSRIKIISSGSIFTTTSYNKSPKRINYCALVSDGNFLFIDSFIILSDGSKEGRLFLLGKVLGVESKTHFLPKPIDGVTFSVIPGMMTKVVGKGPLVAYDALDIVTKCVVASEHDLTESYVVTALPNNLETD